MHKSLNLKVRSGLIWSLAGVFSGRFLQFIGDIILSRILAPEDFGLIAIALAVLAISEMLTETGFNSALIQKQEDISNHLNTAWSMEILKSLCLFILLILFAQPLSKFYNEARAYNLFLAISLLFILRGFRNVGIVYFRKNIEMHKQMLIDIIPFIFQLIFIIPSAIYFQNVWAIMIGIYIRRIVELALSYILHPYRPKFIIEKDALSELFNFGKWIFFISIIGAVRKNFTPLFIGRVFDMDILGYFNRAELFSTLLFTILVQIVWQVGYPAISIIHSDKLKLKKIYIDCIFVICYFSFSLLSILFLLSEEIIIFFLTEKWLNSVFMMKMLLPVGALSLVSCMNAIIFQSIGKPFISTKTSFYSLIILILCTIVCAYYLGIYGVISSIIIASLFNFLYGCTHIKSLLNLNFRKLIFIILYSLINAILFYISLKYVKIFLFYTIGLVELISLSIIGLIIFIILMLLGHKVTNFSIYKLIRFYY